MWSKVAQQSELTEIRIPLSDGLAGHVALTGEVLNIRHAYQDDRFLPLVDRQTGFKTETVLCAPIINRKGDIIGVVAAAVIGTMLTAAVASSAADGMWASLAGNVLGLALPALIVLISVLLTWILYRHFSRKLAE